jgi:DNA-binding XRE family transcriptional regulator
MLDRARVTALRQLDKKRAAIEAKLKTMSFAGRLQLECLPIPELCRRANEFLPEGTARISPALVELWAGGQPCRQPAYQIAITRAQLRHLTAPTTGGRIKEARMQAGLTQRDLGQLLGKHVDQAAVSNYECDRRTPDLNDLAALFGRLPEEFVP